MEILPAKVIGDSKEGLEHELYILREHEDIVEPAKRIIKPILYMKFAGNVALGSLLEHFRRDGSRQ